MNKAPTVCVLTANRLRDGTVVFLDFEGAWSEMLLEALVARSPDEVRALKDRGSYDAIRNVIVEPHLIEVHETASGLLPTRYRERVRAAGPGVLDDVPGYSEPAAGRHQLQQASARSNARQAHTPQHGKSEGGKEGPMRRMLAGRAA
jgi:hypothetical protein